MLLEQINKLILKVSPAMMLFLPLNVSNRLLQLRRANTEGAISFLPSEFPMLTECIVNPFRRSAFN